MPRWPVTVLLLASIFGLVMVGVYHERAGALNPGVEGDPATADYLIPNTFAELAEESLDSVVAVYVKYDQREELRKIHEQIEPFKEYFEDDPELREFFNMPQPGEEGEDGQESQPMPGMPEARASGSGVIISEDGYIVTNHHIISAALQRDGTFAGDRVSVVLNDDTEVPPEKVEVLATDTLADVAVLKIDPEGLDLKPLKWGDSDSLRIGDWVMAIGNPLDLRGSVSSGIVSAKGREIGKVGIEHLIQTDAMINPGNSGGALLNLRGELIGINMAIATTSGYFQGIGFAIPSNDAKYITDQVIKEGKIERGYIGIEMQDLEDEELRQALGMEDQEGGILVRAVREGAPADKAGIEPYDVILEIDDVPIMDTGDLLEIIAMKRVGETAQIEVLRNEGGALNERTFQMEVGARPPDHELSRILQSDSWGAGPQKVISETDDPLGLVLEPIVINGNRGLEVTEVASESPASEIGIMAGDIVIEVNQQRVTTMDGYEEALEAAPRGEPITVRFYSRRAGREMISAIEIPEEEE